MSALRVVSRAGLVALFAAALAACGGGGGGSRTGPAPVTPVTPPPAPPPPPPPALPTSDSATGFTFDFRLYYQESEPNALPKIYTKVATGDFNGDGRDDLAAMLQLSELRVFLQGQDGSLGAPWAYQQPINFSWREVLIVADFDNDGADDIVFDIVKPTGTPAMMMVRHGAGAQAGLEASELPTVRHNGGSHDVPNGYVALDFNADGNMDLVEIHGWKTAEWNAANCSPDETCARMMVYPGDGHGALGAPVYVPWKGVPDVDNRGFFTQDIDMDGREDVVFMSLFGYPQQSRLYAMKRKPDGALEDPVLLLDMVDGTDAPPFFGDFDSDGRTDLIYGPLVHFRAPDGTFRAPLALGLRYYLESYWNVLGDFDGNGATDILNHQFESFTKNLPYFVTYLQKGGQLRPPFFLYDPPSTHLISPDKWGRQSAAVGDYNGDGCRDVAVAAQYSGLLFLEGRNCILPTP